MKAKPDSSDSLVFECDFEDPPEKVWRALTEPELLQAWLTADETVHGEPTHSEPVRGEPAPAAGEAVRTSRRAASSEYEILTAEPHRTLRYRWRDRESGVGDSGSREVRSVVTVELAPGEAGGTHLRLTHGEFEIVTAAPPMVAARVKPITSMLRRRTPIRSLALQPRLRRAA